MDYSSLHLHNSKEQNNLFFSDFHGQIHSLDCSEGSAEFLSDASFMHESDSFFIRLRSFHTVIMDAKTVSTCTLKGGFGLLYSESGCGTVDTAAEIMKLQKGSGALLDLSEPVRLSSGDTSWNFTFMILSGELCHQLYKAQSIGKHYFAASQFPDFEDRQFLILKRLGYNGQLSSYYTMSSHLDHLLTKIVICSKEELSENKTLIMHIISYLQEHFHEDINIEELAASYNFSVSHFRKIFSANMQCSPKQYLIRLRLENACELLKGTDLTVEEIGLKCGFSNPNHFIQTFRKSMQLTPLQYRKASLSE